MNNQIERLQNIISQKNHIDEAMDKKWFSVAVTHRIKLLKLSGLAYHYSSIELSGFTVKKFSELDSFVKAKLVETINNLLPTLQEFHASINPEIQKEVEALSDTNFLKEQAK